MEIHYYDSSFEKFTETLDPGVRKKVLRMITLLEQSGSELRMPVSRFITRNLFELRIRGEVEIRIFYAFHKRAAYILHTIHKQSQHTSPREIRTATRRRNDLERT